ncbi:Csp1 family four helix bundle copper storage protein [Nannocystis bainbridge]|uniref:Csp1 family four helix bundle copper storage protein n=1 Tax=Nannocystis bainbridge TaxID=2995303 RepID=A0ABT5DYQ3_9BACT|nr:Csp1 family four helix bundle copper storage protein [Nannocystis bainbridge]MDC0717572.1 Csp1 family four helix bundle copper storage protein [Nannocystis bainbridge]
MQRREFVLGSPAVLATTACSSAPDELPPPPAKTPGKPTAPPAAPTAAPTAVADPHAGHGDHGDHAGHHAGDDATLTVATDCLKTGEVCVQHCFVLLGQGDTSMAACARSAHEMLAVTRALLVLAAGPSEHLPAQAKVALAVGERCEAECRKHEAKHPACKACAEACKAAVTRYRTLAG